MTVINHNEAAVLLQVVLNGVRPAVQRAVEVSDDVSLERLHLILNAAMGWENRHLWEFRVGKVTFRVPDGFDSGRFVDARSVSLAALMAKGSIDQFTYFYDFGDGWEHRVMVEGVVEGQLDAVYPRLVEAKGACPPEDVGGPSGYAEFLEALSDHHHERHQELRDWAPAGFDAKRVDRLSLEKKLTALAKAWGH